MRGGWVSLLGVTLLCAAGAAWAAGDGPTTAQQAETWGEQLGGLVAQAAGVSFKEGKVPTVRLATAKEAGARLEAEFAAYLPAALQEELPEPEALGGQFLARYLFSHRGIVLVPDVVRRTPAYIETVIPDTDAAKEGLQPDDLIVFANGELVGSIRTLESVVRRLVPGDDLQLTVRRGDALISLTFRVPRRP